VLFGAAHLAVYPPEFIPLVVMGGLLHAVLVHRLAAAVHCTRAGHLGAVRDPPQRPGRSLAGDHRHRLGVIAVVAGTGILIADVAMMS